MTWATLDPAIRRIAETTLTPTQLRILQLGLEYPDGARFRPLALRLGVTRTHVVDTWDRAHTKLARHGVTVTEHGHYHLRETA